ncbi:MAG: DUF1566 domain-containing protein [Planctomycetes bacterium]|nr:DUF1566 domain-containing protein [Planctomycetota bacterium]
MKRILGFAMVLGLGVAIGWTFHGAGRVAQGGGVGVCATLNGDVNADGTLDQSDAIVILTKAFLDPAQPISPVCMPPDLTAQVQKLEAQLADCRAGNCPPSGLPDTGQTKCYDQAGSEIPCDGATCPGQDGAYATGCPSGGGRFIDNQDGTVTDTCTGLMWFKGIHVGDSWCEGLSFSESLSHAGHDDWRLPNVRELQSIVDYGRSPTIDPVFFNFSQLAIWSSTSFSGNPAFAYWIDTLEGNVHVIAKDESLFSINGRKAKVCVIPAAVLRCHL